MCHLNLVNATRIEPYVSQDEHLTLRFFTSSILTILEKCAVVTSLD